MRKAALAVFALHCACAFGEVTRNTEWQDVPDTTKVGTVLDLGGASAITAGMATNIAGRVTSNVVTKAYVEGLGIGGGLPDRITNALNVITADGKWLTNTAQNMWQTNYLCTVAAAQAKATAAEAAAKADANGKFLPKDGNTPMSGQKLYLFNGQGETTGFVLDNMGVLNVKNVNATGTMKFYGRVETPSELNVDGSPVATSNMVEDVVDSKTYTKSAANAKFLDKTSRSETMMGSLYIDGGLAQISDGHVVLGTEEQGDGSISFSGGAQGNEIGYDTEEDAHYFSKSEYYSYLYPDNSPVMTENKTEATFAANADYALTNLAGAVSLRSGEIGNLTTNANFTLALDFSEAANRSGDCLLYLVNADAANDHTITVAPNTLDVRGLGSDWLTAPKASTNLFMFTRVKANTVIVSRQEVK